jgi:hypothetical protein
MNIMIDAIGKLHPWKECQLFGMCIMDVNQEFAIKFCYILILYLLYMSYEYNDRCNRKIASLKRMSIIWYVYYGY